MNSKLTTLLSTFFVMSSLYLNGQITLKIVVDNLEPSTGFVLMDFRDGDDKELIGISEKVANNECTITIDSLQAGKYSFKYFHDENDNKKMDKYWIGAPKEGIGFSNNAKIKFRAPPLEDTIFEIKKDTTIHCTVYYIKFN